MRRRASGVRQTSCREFAARRLTPNRHSDYRTEFAYEPELRSLYANCPTDAETAEFQLQHSGVARRVKVRIFEDSKNKRSCDVPKKMQPVIG